MMIRSSSLREELIAASRAMAAPQGRKQTQATVKYRHADSRVPTWLGGYYSVTCLGLKVPRDAQYLSFSAFKIYTDKIITANVMLKS